jgi:hypothetical protein
MEVLPTPHPNRKKHCEIHPYVKRGMESGWQKVDQVVVEKEKETQ